MINAKGVAPSIRALEIQRRNAHCDLGWPTKASQRRWDLSCVLRKEKDYQKEDHSIRAGSVVNARGRDVNADCQGRLRPPQGSTRQAEAFVSGYRTRKLHNEA